MNLCKLLQNRPMLLKKEPILLQNEPMSLQNSPNVSTKYMLKTNEV